MGNNDQVGTVWDKYDDITILDNSVYKTLWTGKDRSLPHGTTLPTALLTASDGAQYRALFDQGSQATLIDKDLADKLKLTLIGKERVALSGINQTKPASDYDRVQLKVLMGNQVIEFTALTTNDIPTSFRAPGLSRTASKLLQQGVILADNYERDVVEDIRFLIGCDQYYQFIRDFKQIGDYHLLSTASGYMLSGPVGTIPNYDHCQLLFSTIELDDLHKLWDLDTIGIRTDDHTTEEDDTHQSFLKTTHFDKGQYWVNFPFKENIKDLPSNRHRAAALLRHSLLKLHKQPSQLEAYDAAIQQLINNDFVEDVPQNARKENVHYLPHHGVHKDSASTPLRVVFNASSKTKDEWSLNDCLMTGPNMTERLADTLLKFRVNQYGYSADISKAFLRIGLKESDRDYTRFFWVHNPTDLTSPLRELRFKSVLFGATSSPFLLQATIDMHLENSLHPCSKELRGRFYMDNLIGSTKTLEELTNIYYGAKEIMTEANFPLQQWATNAQELWKSMVDNGDEPEMKISVLGYEWNPQVDQIGIKQPQWAELKMTKRNLLRLVSTLFDPLGLITPLTIKCRALMQEAHKLKKGWDEPLPEEFGKNWGSLLKEIEDPTDIPFPRAVTYLTEVDLHVFCDASGKAYGAVAYVVVGNTSHLLTSKARVTPVEAPTLPRLELLSILVGAKLVKYILDTLDHLTFRGVHVWADNEPSIQWIRNRQSPLVFVKNQVEKILNIRRAYPFTLRHVPTQDNPADWLSRGTTKGKLMKSNWFHGPAWLTKLEDWPVQKEHVAMLELRSETLLKPEEPVMPLAFLDETTISSWLTLLRQTRSIYRVAKAWGIHTDNWPRPDVYWLRKTQREHFPMVIAIVKNGRAVPQGHPSRVLVNQLGLYWDQRDELVHCRGRLEAATVTKLADCPILIPSISHITRLLVEFHHLCTFHGGVNSTLASLRQHVWIPKGRTTVKRILRPCVVCIRKTRAQIIPPGPPPLPVERVTLTRPFLNIGVDYSGHILVKDSQDEQPNKVYICLFTCMATRAVHLELAKDLSAATFLNLFKRFVYEHGVPRLIVSDNGSNFVAVDGALKNIEADHTVQTFLQEKFIKWKFIRPRAPWEGGFYERLIGLVKKTLFNMIHRKILSYDELFTLLKGAQVCVNNRPLTYISNDEPTDLPLTPNHLVKGRRIDSFPSYEIPPEDDPDYENADYLRECHNRATALNDRFRVLWTKNYLTALRERHLTPSTDQKLDLQPGDIVLVETEFTRDYWPLGKIVKLLPDHHGQVRAAEVRVEGKLVEKTLNQLVPMEVSSRFHASDRPFEEVWSELRPGITDTQDQSMVDSIEPENVNMDNSELTETEPESRSRREAAKGAMNKFRKWGREGLI